MAPRARLYVGNTPFTATEQDIIAFFGEIPVSSVKLIADRETGRPRGFAFVDVTSLDDMQRAISTLDGLEMGGRRLVISQAKERESASQERRAPSQDRRDDRGGRGRQSRESQWDR